MSDSPALDAIAEQAKAMDRAAGKGDKWRKTNWSRFRARWPKGLGGKPANKKKQG